MKFEILLTSCKFPFFCCCNRVNVKWHAEYPHLKSYLVSLIKNPHNIRLFKALFWRIDIDIITRVTQSVYVIQLPLLSKCFLFFVSEIFFQTWQDKSPFSYLPAFMPKSKTATRWSDIDGTVAELVINMFSIELVLALSPPLS